MQVRDPNAILQKLGDRNLKVDSFFLRRTGFLANQTVLKLGEYNLNCVPASFGREEARFLVALTPNEISLFSKFKEGTHLLMLTFDDPDGNDVARFPLRVGLADITPVPERKDICFLELKLKSMPTEFILFLGLYIDGLESRLESWETLSTKTHTANPDMLLAAGLGYGAVLSLGEARFSVEIVNFHTKRIGFQLSDGTSLPAGINQFHMVFQGRPLNLSGTLEGTEAFLPEFNPDWLDFVEQVQLRESFQLRPKSGARS